MKIDTVSAFLVSAVCICAGCVQPFVSDDGRADRSDEDEDQDDDGEWATVEGELDGQTIGRLESAYFVQHAFAGADSPYFRLIVRASSMADGCNADAAYVSSITEATRTRAAGIDAADGDLEQEMAVNRTFGGAVVASDTASYPRDYWRVTVHEFAEDAADFHGVASLQGGSVTDSDVQNASVGVCHRSEYPEIFDDEDGFRVENHVDCFNGEAGTILVDALSPSSISLTYGGSVLREADGEEGDVTITIAAERCEAFERALTEYEDLQSALGG